MTQPPWVKSTYCESSTCVEVQFTRSSKCDHATCVEVAATPDEVLMRDGKDPDGAVLAFDPASWRAFVDGLRAGELVSS